MTETTGEKLLPCPFCGNDNVSFNDAPSTYAMCDSCGTEGAWNDHGDYVRAAKAWNARTAAPVDHARVAELEKAARALIDDVKRRHPGEALQCPYMIALDAALATPTEGRK